MARPATYPTARPRAIDKTITGAGAHYESGFFGMAPGVLTYQVAKRFGGRPSRVKVWASALVNTPTYRLSNIAQPPGNDINLLHDASNADTPWVPGGEILEVRDLAGGTTIIAFLAVYDE